jgi:hypothetical protein
LAPWGGPAALVLAGYLRVLDPGRKFADHRSAAC